MAYDGSRLARCGPSRRRRLLRADLGQWDSAHAHFQRAERLDPRSIDPPRNVMQVLLHMRRFPEARAAADRALALAPANIDLIQYKAKIALAEGDRGPPPAPRPCARLPGQEE